MLYLLSITDMMSSSIHTLRKYSMPSNKNLKPCLFLDRDGVIIEDVGYLSDPQKVKLIAGISDLIKWFKEQNGLIIVLTNQSGISRGYFKEAAVLDVHAKIDSLLKAENAMIDGWYYCPYHPDGDAKYEHLKNDRKPNPGMVLKALENFPIDRKHCYMIGDKVSDNLEFRDLKVYLLQGDYPLDKAPEHVDISKSLAEILTKIKNLHNAQ